MGSSSRTLINREDALRTLSKSSKCLLSHTGHFKDAACSILSVRHLLHTIDLHIHNSIGQLTRPLHRRHVSSPKQLESGKTGLTSTLTSSGSRVGGVISWICFIADLKLDLVGLPGPLIFFGRPPFERVA